MCDYCEGRGDDVGEQEEVIEPDYEPEEENEA